MLWRHPTTPASKHRVPPQLSGSRAWPSHGSHRVWFCRQETIDKVRAGEGLRFGSAVASELSPYPAEREQPSILVEGEPNDVFLLGLRVRFGRIFGEAVGRYQTTIFRFQPGAPMWRPAW